MDELEDILKNDYDDAKKTLGEVGRTNAEVYTKTLEDCDKIRSEMIECKRIKYESEMKDKELETKKHQELQENIRTYLKVGTVVILSIGSAILTHRHFKETLDFDRVSTSTSTNGKKTIGSASSFDSFKLFGLLK